MLRFAAQRILSASLKNQLHNSAVSCNAANRYLYPAMNMAMPRLYSSAVVESEEEFDSRYVAFFNNPEVDGWDVRKGMHDLFGMDLVPEPKIIIAALRACRRLNDYSLTTRFLETVEFKCRANKDLWPYVLKEIKPTLDELGISTPAELGYDKPELALKSVFDMHG